MWVFDVNEQLSLFRLFAFFCSVCLLQEDGSEDLEKKDGLI